MPAPNRQADLEEIHRRMGSPALLGEDIFANFMRKAIACLAFGAPAWGIAGDPRWGRRKNSTGTISKDTLRYGNVQAIDTASGAGLPGWKWHWNTYEPGEDGFGVGLEPARRSDLPAGSQVVIAPPPPPPPPTSDATLDSLARNINDARREIRVIGNLLIRIFK